MKIGTGMILILFPAKKAGFFSHIRHCWKKERETPEQTAQVFSMIFIFLRWSVPCAMTGQYLTK